MRLLAELHAGLTPVERDEMPSSLMRILPQAEKLTDTAQPPIHVERSKWVRQQEPECLVRTYDFDEYSALTAFVHDVLDYQRLSKHHGELLIGENQILVKVSTANLNRVTELDIEYAKELDGIYHDVHFQHMGLS